MSKNKRHRPERYVKLRYWLLDSAAWQSLPGGACALYVKMAQRYNGSNNGRIPFSVREAMQVVHVSKGMAKYLLDVLQDRGFIVCTKRGAFSLKTGREASQWRLTEYDNDVIAEYATKEFMRWWPPEVKESPSEFKTRFTGVNGTVHRGERYGSPRDTVRPKKGRNGSPRDTKMAKTTPRTVHPETHSIATRWRGPSPEAGEVATAPADEEQQPPPRRSAVPAIPSRSSMTASAATAICGHGVRASKRGGAGNASTITTLGSSPPKPRRSTPW
jgi:hypothetical protein